MSTDSENSECQIAYELLKYIKANSKTNIINCLTLLKNDPKCHKYISKGGGLELLVGLLRYQNLEVLNLTLSILANASLSPDVRDNLQITKVAAYTLRLLKKFKKEYTLHCRACRLIGNLSESQNHAKTFFEIGVVPAIVELFKSNINNSTYLMAVRAVRNIWNTYEVSRNKILESNAISHIASIFVKSSNKRSDSKYAELTEACLKAMCAFLSNLDPRCGYQVRGETNESYKNIAELCKSGNKLAIKCLYQLCQIAECRPELGNSGVVDIIVSLIKADEILSWEILASLSLFCREAVNRYRVRTSSGLELILSLLKQPEHEKYHSILLHALTHFVHDDASIVVMVKNGLLEVLTEKLKKMIIHESREEEIKGSTKKRIANFSSCGDTRCNKVKSSRYSLDYYQEDWSPRDTTSGSSSPQSTPPLSCYDSRDAEDSAEDNYSPVCSDSEFVENEDEPQEEVESVKSCKSATLQDFDSSDRMLKTSTEEHGSNWTLVLLSRLSYSNEPIERLADPTTIEPLVAYIKSAKSYRASRILVRIIRNNSYLLSLIKQGFVFEAQTMFGSEQYIRQMCDLAKTGGVIGELSSILLRGQESHKYIIAVSIPFLITSKYLLKRLLKDHGGLPLIFYVLNNREHFLYEKAIWSICCLAGSLDIRPETANKSQSLDSSHISGDFGKSCENQVKLPTVTFELDDGTTVDACRRTLCQKSDAFSAMLEGNFSESGKRRVKLKNTSKEGLHTLLLAANGATFENRAIESLLDAVLLADKFLMTDVFEILTESSLSKLNYENFSRAWNWARKNSCGELKTCCVKSFLATRMTNTEREQAFRDFSSNESFPEFLEEVHDIINDVLCQS